MRRLVALALLSALLSCNPAPDASRPPFTLWTTTTIEVTWLKSDEEVTKRCGELGLKGQVNGCARSRPNDISTCEIYAVQPKDFDDTKRLEVLGHEVAHCLGAKHD